MSAQALIDAACKLSHAVTSLKFSAPVTHAYNPLDYAWAAHEQYLRRYGKGHKRIVFLGMNPGPLRHDADRRAVRRDCRHPRLARP